MSKVKSLLKLVRDNGAMSTLDYAVARYIKRTSDEGLLRGTASKRRKPAIVASLSSNAERIGSIGPTLQSLCGQLFKPNRIVCWLPDHQFPNGFESLPYSVQLFREFGVEFCFCPEPLCLVGGYAAIRRKCPHDIVVVFDDRVQYPNDAVQRLYESYLANPKAVSALHAHLAMLDENRRIKQFSEWMLDCSLFQNEPRFDLVAVSSGGVLFPPDNALGVPDESQDVCAGVVDLLLKERQVELGMPVVLVARKLDPDRVRWPINRGVSELLFAETEEIEAWVSARSERYTELFASVDAMQCSRRMTKSGDRRGGPLRVLFMMGDGYHTGATLSTLTLAKLLQDRGVEPFVVFPEEGDAQEEANKLNLEWTVVPAVRWVQEFDRPATASPDYRGLLITNMNAIYEIMGLLAERDIDLVHTSSISIGIGALAAYRMHRKTVWHLREFLQEDHGQEFWNENEALDALRRCDRAICISKSIQRKYASLFEKEGQCSMVYNGLDIDRYLCEEHEILKGDVITIVVAGRIEEGKSQLDLIRALPLMGEASRSVLVLLIGQQPFKDDPSSYYNVVCREVVALGLEDNVLFIDSVPDMETYWREADIAVVCSRFEAFGRVTVEAMLAGCYVVGANTAGTAEIIADGETGALYEACNPAALADSLLYAIGHVDDARAIASRGRDHARKTFTAERNADGVYKVYRGLGVG